jgi:hypothetical protein
MSYVTLRYPLKLNWRVLMRIYADLVYPECSDLLVCRSLRRTKSRDSVIAMHSPSQNDVASRQKRTPDITQGLIRRCCVGIERNWP